MSKEEIKKYRPFNNPKECWDEMLKHQPFGWIRFTEDKEFYQNILIVHRKGLMLDLEDITFSFSESLESMCFADGTPFGIKGEE